MEDARGTKDDHDDTITSQFSSPSNLPYNLYIASFSKVKGG